MTISRPAVAIHIFEIDRSVHNPVDRGRLSGDRVIIFRRSSRPVCARYTMAVTVPLGRHSHGENRS
jgi:hypothetical protein